MGGGTWWCMFFWGRGGGGGVSEKPSVGGNRKSWGKKIAYILVFAFLFLARDGHIPWVPYHSCHQISETEEAQGDGGNVFIAAVLPALVIFFFFFFLNFSFFIFHFPTGWNGNLDKNLY